MQLMGSTALRSGNDAAQGDSTSSTISQWSPLPWRNTNIEEKGADAL